MLVKDAIVTIKLEHGQIELSVPQFLESDLTAKKINDISILCKESDRKYNTNVVSEMLSLCNLMLQGELGLYRRTIKNKTKIQKLISILGTVDIKPKLSKKLF